MKRGRSPQSDEDGDSHQRAFALTRPHIVTYNQHYHGPVNHIGRVSNANFGINYGLISQTTQNPVPGFVPPIDLYTQLNPILDASHTRNMRISPPNSKCFPGTRQETLGMVLSWARCGMYEDEPHIMWIYGYAGCGKSAISQALAEQLSKEGRLAASFFFFRGSGDRSRATRLVNTIAHQLAVAFPAMAAIIEGLVRSDPGLLSTSTSSLSNQFERLVFEPIATVAASGTLQREALVVILDGVDECQDREELAAFIEYTIDFFSKNVLIPLRIVIASRVEDHIQRELHSSPQVELLDLVMHTSDTDIYTALTVSINKAKHGRVLACDDQWPSSDQMWELVQHIGGSYIFMTTVIKLLFSPGTRDGLTPMERLPRILEMGPDFDQLYREILEPSAHFPHFSEIMTTIALTFKPLSIVQLAELLEIKPVQVTNVLINLHAIIQVPGDDISPVTLWHTSLRDFLCSESRAGPFFASPSHHQRLAYRTIELAASGCRLLKKPIRVKLKPSERPHCLEYSQKCALTHLARCLDTMGETVDLFNGDSDRFMALLSKPIFHERRTTLDIVCHDAEWKLARALVNAGSNVNVQFDSNYSLAGTTVALHIACYLEEKEMIYFLLEKGANPNIVNPPPRSLQVKADWTIPLVWAATEGDVDLVKKLLACGANANIHGGFYDSAIHASVRECHDEVALALLEHGANPNTKDRDGRPPLHYALSDKHANIAQYLRHFGGSLENDRNKKWRRVHDAYFRGNITWEELLQSDGSDASLKIVEGDAENQEEISYQGKKTDMIYMLLCERFKE